VLDAAGADPDFVAFGAGLQISPENARRARMLHRPSNFDEE